MPVTDLLIVTGSMGSGKTTVMAEASDILSMKGVRHASIDLDALAMGHFPSGVASADVIAYRNLRCVWENYAALGLAKLLLAGAIESRSDLQGCRDAVSAGITKVCRLTAGLQTMQQRVRTRESGILQAQFVERVGVLNAILDRARLEDFSVVNDDNRSVSEVAREMLVHAGWLQD